MLVVSILTVLDEAKHDVRSRPIIRDVAEYGNTVVSREVLSVIPRVPEEFEKRVNFTASIQRLLDRVLEWRVL